MLELYYYENSCPVRKSDPDVFVMQVAEDRNSDDAAERLHRSP